MKIPLIFSAASLLLMGNIVLGMEEANVGSLGPFADKHLKSKPKLAFLLKEISADPSLNKFNSLESENKPDPYHLQLQKQFGDPPPQRSKTLPSAPENTQQVVVWGQAQGYQQNLSQIWSVILSIIWG